MFPGSPPLPRGYSLASTFKLFFDRGERPIAIPRALLAWYFHFWCRFASYGGNDLWPARFVLGSASNQGDNHDRSCWCSFFSFLRKIFLGLVRVFLGSCWCSTDEAWRWWIGERRTKSRRIIFQNERWKNSSLSSCWFELELHISWNLVIFLLRIRTAKCVVQTYFFFFTSIPHREICRFPKCDVFGKGSRTIFHSERSAETITGELPARGRGLASETGAKYGKTGDFRVAERATSRAQLFLGMEIIGTNETWKNSSPFLRFWPLRWTPIWTIPSAWESMKIR